MSDLVVRGNASGTGAVTLQSPNTNSALSLTLPATDAVTLGYLNVPAAGTKTGSYTLAVAAIGEFVEISTGGNVSIPNAVFSAGDVVSLVNNTNATVTVHCPVGVAYVAGTDTDRNTVNISTRGIATVLFLNSNTCIITGSVS